MLSSEFKGMVSPAFSNLVLALCLHRRGGVVRNYACSAAVHTSEHDTPGGHEQHPKGVVFVDDLFQKWNRPQLHK